MPEAVERKRKTIQLGIKKNRVVKGELRTPKEQAYAIAWSAYKKAKKERKHA